MNNVKINSNLCWKWNDKFIPLNRLHVNQLNNIRNFIGKNPKNYFNATEEEWQVNIKHQLDYRRVDESISRQVRNKRTPLHSGANLGVIQG